MLKPLIPPHLVALALAIGAALFAAGQYLPAPYAHLASALGSVALFLGGLGWRAPSWSAGKPLVPATLVPLALAAAGLLEQFGPLLPVSVQEYAALASGFLGLVAGKLLPEPLKSTPSAPIPVGIAQPLVTPGPVVQLAPECSLAQEAQGKCPPAIVGGGVGG
jgi:hypothetical protein